MIKQYLCCASVVLATVVTISVGSAVFSHAGEAEGKPAAKDQVEKKGSLRVEDLPKPIPKVMEKIKEVGDEAGKGITKAGSAIGEAVNKAVKGEKDKEK